MLPEYHVPVVTVGNKNNSFLIHGGAVHFSKETMDDGSYGSVVQLAEKSWLPETRGRLISISQEHGILEASNLEIGEAVAILPVHSCLTAECMTKYLTTTGIYVDHYQKSR
jgi:D-serine deaminase-like pyridoxal phosphate-dependent protein